MPHLEPFASVIIDAIPKAQGARGPQVTLKGLTPFSDGGHVLVRYVGRQCA